MMLEPGQARGNVEEPLSVDALRNLPRSLALFHLMRMVEKGRLTPEEAARRLESASGTAEPSGSPVILASPP